MKKINSFEESIVFQIINTKANEEALKTMPHRNILDLSVIYRIIKDGEEKEITNDFAKMVGASEQELYNLAMENTERLYPVEITDIRDIINAPSAFPMWIINSTPKERGARTLLYKNVLQDLAEEINDNLFILPSSIHEVLAIHADYKALEGIKRIVKAVNKEQVVAPCEQLGENVYFYDKEAKQLSIATDCL